MDDVVLPGANIDFFKEIDALFTKTGDYMGSVIHLCEIKDIDLTHIATLLQANNIAVARIRCDAEALHFLKRERRIPL